MRRRFDLITAAADGAARRGTLRRRVPLAALWAASIVVAWLVVAVRLGQPIWQQQRSQALVAFGAFKGAALTMAGAGAGAWRVIAAQWLHVNAAHMLLNAAIIAIAGTALERRCSRGVMVAVGLGGGTVAQLIGAVAEPGGFVSGASPAALALCGAVLVAMRRSLPWAVALAGTVIAVALDAVSAGGPKAAHVAAFAIGCAAGIIVRRDRGNRSRLDDGDVAV